MPMTQNDSCAWKDISFGLFCGEIQEVQRFRAELLRQTFSFFGDNGYMLIDPPILHEHIANRTETISVSLHNRLYDLNASNALYISVCATVFGKVFAVSPTFRDEKEPDNHLIEFRMLECEAPDFDFYQCIELTQNYIKFILKKMLKKFANSRFEKRLCLLWKTLQFDMITYKDLVERLKKTGVSINYGDDLSDCDLEVSTILTNPTFVIDYPCPPATWTALPKDNGTTYTFNFLLPDGYGELVEGCQRNNDYTVFQDKFEKAGIRSLSWYVEAIKRNPCIRSGFGLGIERLIGWLTGITHIQKTILFNLKED
jgi:asparaginyl-tRNA synthetase